MGRPETEEYAVSATTLDDLEKSWENSIKDDKDKILTHRCLMAFISLFTDELSEKIEHCQKNEICTLLWEKCAPFPKDTEAICSQIAERVGIDKKEVLQRLRYAGRTHIFSVPARSPGAVSALLEDKLETIFRKGEGREAAPHFRVIVAQIKGSHSPRKEEMEKAVAEAAAEYFVSVVPKEKRANEKSQSLVSNCIAVSGGNTMLKVAEEIGKRKTEYRNLKVLPLAGEAEPDRFNISANSVALKLAQACGAPRNNTEAHSLMTTPIIVKEEGADNEPNKEELINDIRDALLKNRGIQQVIQELKNAKFVFTGIGGSAAGSALFRLAKHCGIGDEKDEIEATITAQNVIGDICYLPIDKDGNSTWGDLSKLLIGLELDDLKKMSATPERRVFAVACGTSKSGAIIAAIRGGLVNGLITDEVTAFDIVKKLKKETITPAEEHICENELDKIVEKASFLQKISSGGADVSEAEFCPKIKKYLEEHGGKKTIKDECTPLNDETTHKCIAALLQILSEKKILGAASAAHNCPESLGETCAAIAKKIGKGFPPYEVWQKLKAIESILTIKVRCDNDKKQKLLDALGELLKWDENKKNDFEVIVGKLDNSLYPQNENRQKAVAGAAADYFCEHVKEGISIAVSGGNTMLEVVKEIEKRRAKPFSGVKIYPLAGEAEPNCFQISANSVALRLEQACGDESAENNDNATKANSLMTSPIVTENQKSIDSITQSYANGPGNKYENFTADYVFTGIGGYTTESALNRLLEYCGLKKSSFRRDRDAVGDICYFPIDEEGKLTWGKLANRLFGVRPEKLQEMAGKPEKKHRIFGVACGNEKVKAIIAAIRGGLINGLITDECTADEILKKLKELEEGK